MTTTDDILDLRRRVEALEQRAATEESSATEPAPAPAADRLLWKQMHLAYYEAVGVTESWASVLDVVADWLAARGYPGAAELLRAEAQRAREGA
jgi:hypothetical protein